MAPLGTSTRDASIQSAAIRLTVTEDLQSHGGEDCVIERCRGRMLFFNARQNTGATPAPIVGGFICRVVLADTEVTDQAAGLVAPDEFLTSEGMGRDTILWYRDVFVTGSSLLGSGTTGVAEASTFQDGWFDIDVRAKRKLQSDRQLVMWFQTVVAGLTANFDFRLIGGLRMLLKRPR